ncbi:kinase-like domain-containing protein [Mycena haematopus]|nr:kinase-like domain-containing protein [Mycena haematopus]
MSLPPVDPDADHEVDHHLWAYLVPRGKNPNLMRIDFWRISATAKLGRDPSRNTLILPGPHISGVHAEISWNGKNGEHSVITLKDLSSGGTWVSGKLVGRNKSQVLKDEDEIGFGAPIAIDDNNGLYDYRFQFRDVSVKQSPEPLDDMYDYGKILGEGTGGSVSLATEKGGTNKVVAIKKIKYLETRMDVFTEITVMERVRHPHVTRIFSAHHAESEPLIYLVLEYMQGGDLMAYMIREHHERNLWPEGPPNRGLPENICREIMYQLCHAMAFLHAQGITHRDLKPENILLRDDKSKDATPFIKVADFGLASVTDVMKSLCGTVAYAAPEVLSPAKPGYNYLADSFSAGILLFAMLILTDPWCEPRTVHSQWPGLHWKSLSTQILCPAGFDLLDHLVNPDPLERLSLAGVLKHAWMKAHQPMHHRLEFPQ